MKSFEEFLVMQRANPEDSEVVRLSKLKGISDQQAKAEALRTYIESKAPSGVELVVNTAEMTRFMVAIKDHDLVGFDIETAKTCEHPLAGLNPKVSRIRTMQFYFVGQVWVIDCFKVGLDWFNKIAHKNFIIHNAVFEGCHLLEAGRSLTRFHDTMLESRVFLNKGLSLADLAKEFLGISISKALQVSDWSRPQLLQEQLEYAAADAVIAYELHEHFQHWFEGAEEEYLNAYQFLLMTVTPIVHQQTLGGIPVNHDKHQAYIDEWSAEKKEAAALLLNKGLTNPDSPKDIAGWLEGALTPEELDEWPKTDKGNLSGGKAALEQAENFPSITDLVRYKAAAAKLANFGDGMRAKLINGKLYPSFKIGGAESLRFTCSEPNIQNFPRGSFKEIFQAETDFKFVAGDLSQIELRTAAYLADEPVLIEAYKNGEDLHAAMSADVRGCDVSAVDKEGRQLGKAGNFGLLFGAGAGGLQRQAKAAYGVDIDLATSQQVKDTFHNRYPRLTEWQQWIVKQTNTFGYSELQYSGLRRHFDEEQYTKAMNTPVQGTAAEVLILAIQYVHENKDTNIQIVAHVYDELCLYCPEHKAMETAQLLHNAFHWGWSQVFPDADATGLVDIGIADNWKATDYDNNLVTIREA